MCQYQAMSQASVVSIQEPAGTFRSRFERVPKQIRDAVFGFGWGQGEFRETCDVFRSAEVPSI
jgi:hypothetical protein